MQADVILKEPPPHGCPPPQPLRGGGHAYATENNLTYLEKDILNFSPIVMFRFI